MEKRILPAIQVGFEIDGKSHNEYPDEVIIPMEDGTKQHYQLIVEQPAPVIRRSVEIIRIMKENTYGGYQYKKGQEGRRKRSGRI